MNDSVTYVTYHNITTNINDENSPLVQKTLNKDVWLALQTTTYNLAKKSYAIDANGKP